MNILTLDKARLQALITKYGGAVPRYTSYPTAPEWKHEYSQDIYEAAIRRSNETGQDYSLYLHIPFCESQCYYCGCNVVISPEHKIEQKYIEHLKEELAYYGESIDPARKVVQMAWGGGTPTYLTPDQIVDLYEHIGKYFSLYSKEDSGLLRFARNDSGLKELAQEGYELMQAQQAHVEHEYAIEIDPRVTNKDHLEALYECGFNRLSMGVQDFNLQTQEAINRIQGFADTSLLIEQARDIGFNSINIDLIYGLPYQTAETFSDTIAKVKEIDPDRIAFFNYAHIPSIFPYQKKYIDELTLPNQEEKLNIFAKAVDEFSDFGYKFIGLDHFAKPEDSLSKAFEERSLYRNFQGYTTHSGCDLFGFGITAISDVRGVYKQNFKKLNKYYETIFGADKFMACTADDIERRDIIKQIMCNNYALVDVDKYAGELRALQPFIEDKLLEWDYLDTNKAGMEWAEEVLAKANSLIDTKKIYLKITEDGRFFVRNIASVFDAYLKQEGSHKTFSKSL